MAVTGSASASGGVTAQAHVRDLTRVHRALGQLQCSGSAASASASASGSASGDDVGSLTGNALVDYYYE